MARMRLVSLVAGAAMVAGCAAPAAAPPATGTTTAATTTVAAPPAGAIALTGDLKAPRQLDAAALAALPQQSVDVTFQSAAGAQEHTEKGVPLASVLPVADLATTSAKNSQLSFAVVAVGADGYTAVVAYADALPDFGHRGLLVALVEDGKPLARPRLVVPGDVKGGRYVSDLVELRVVRLGA